MRASLFALLLIACGSTADGEEPDGGFVGDSGPPETDAATQEDTGPRDAGTVTADSGSPDLGQERDAGAADAGPGPLSTCGEPRRMCSSCEWCTVANQEVFEGSCELVFTEAPGSTEWSGTASQIREMRYGLFVFEYPATWRYYACGAQESEPTDPLIPRECGEFLDRPCMLSEDPARCAASTERGTVWTYELRSAAHGCGG